MSYSCLGTVDELPGGSPRQHAEAVRAAVFKQCTAKPKYLCAHSHKLTILMMSVHDSVDIQCLYARR